MSGEPLPPGEPAAVVAEAIRRARLADPRIWISRRDDDGLIRDAMASDGPLAGCLLAVKDNIDVGGIATTAGCRAFAYTPDEDADVIGRLRRAGAIVAGKTTMDMFATGLTGTRGPDGPLGGVLAPHVIAGGSSSGSALAVAAGLVHVGLGTDTAGSGRVPAAFNGIVGLKPTRDLISTAGLVAACRSLDCVSLFTRSVDESMRVLARCLAPTGRSDKVDARAQLRACGAPVIGVPTPEELADDEVRMLFAAARERCREAGWIVREVDVATFIAAGRLLYEGPWVAERTAAVGDFVRRHPEEVDPVVREVILGGATLGAVDTFGGQYRLADLMVEAGPLWEQMDALMVPTAEVAPTLDEVALAPHAWQARLGRFTNFVNLMDLCAISVPAGRWRNGAGFGVQFVAPAFGDALIGTLASRFEALAPAPTVQLCVVGAHLRDQPLNWQMTSRGARFVKRTQTAPIYRLYALEGTTPSKPGLVRCDGDGAGIEVEVWEMTHDAFGSFVAEVPPPLCIGTVDLTDGSSVSGFVCEPIALNGGRDITRYGGWRAFLDANG